MGLVGFSVDGVLLLYCFVLLSTITFGRSFYSLSSFPRHTLDLLLQQSPTLLVQFIACHQIATANRNLARR